MIKRNNLFLLVIFLLSACNSTYRSAEKVLHCNNGIKLKSTESIDVIKPFIFSAKLEHGSFQSFKDSSFKVLPLKYEENQFVEKLYALKAYSDFYRFFKQHLECNLASISNEDYNSLHEELKSIHNQLNEKGCSEIKMSSTMITVLSKQKGDYTLFTELNEYYTPVYSRSSKDHDLFLIRVYLFDKRNRSLIFYNYEITGKTGHNKINQPNFKKALLPMKKNLPDYDYEFQMIY